MNHYTSLAKTAVENYIKERKTISPPEDLPKELLIKKSGVFVTIEKNGVLRGCIGTYLPLRENIAKEIISNAIASATEDYRFGLIQEEELPHFSYTVYVLSRPEQVKDFKELDPQKYGIIIKTIPIEGVNKTDVVFNGHMPHKSGLLLPGLNGIDTVEKQILIACQKGGIDPLKEKFFVYKFTAEKYASEKEKTK